MHHFPKAARSVLRGVRLARGVSTQPFFAEGLSLRQRVKPGKEGLLMSDYELLTVVLMILGIIVSILIAYINHTKK